MTFKTFISLKTVHYKHIILVLFPTSTAVPRT